MEQNSFTKRAFALSQQAHFQTEALVKIYNEDIRLLHTEVEELKKYKEWWKQANKRVMTAQEENPLNCMTLKQLSQRARREGVHTDDIIKNSKSWWSDDGQMCQATATRILYHPESYIWGPYDEGKTALKRAIAEKIKEIGVKNSA